MKPSKRVRLFSRYLPALLLCCAVFQLRPVSAQSVADGYKVPTITVPYAAKRPTLDGVIRDDEWQGAVSLNALQTTTRAVSARQARFWMMWDEDNLYVAMRSPLRPGERLIQALRETGKDVNCVFDDSYEIWLDLGTHSADGQPVFFQYLGNFAGARWDVLQEPAVGNSRLGWTSGWQPHNRLAADGKTWEMEIAIPRRSMFKETPFQDGFAFTGLLSRNFKRPWEQNTLAGSGSFSVRETYANYVLSKTAPAIHLPAVGDPASRTFGLSLAAFSTTGRRVRWVYESDGTSPKEGILTTQSGQLTVLPPMLALDKEGNGSYRIRALSEDGKTTYLDWCAPLKWGGLEALDEKLHDAGDQVGLSITMNPARDYLRVNGDFIDFDARARIARCRVTARDAHSRVIAEKELLLDKLAYARAVLMLPRLSPGAYSAELVAYDKDGHSLLARTTQFVKKDPAKAFPWWNTRVGNADKVLSPWTPVTYNKGRFGVWSRDFSIGAAGLPAQIRAQGEDLLAAPMSLVARMADGTVCRAREVSRKTVSLQPHRAVVEVTSRLGSLAVRSLVTVEYDGMIKVEMLLDPGKPTRIASLRLIAPLRNDAATYLHACGEGIRYGFDYRFLPLGKTGRIWDSRIVDGQPMVVGSFLPYIWLGNPRAGLCWFADSDQGWEPDNKVPAMEIRRDSAKSTDLVLNLIGTPTGLNKARRIVFAFQATPVKPIYDGWRMDTWWTGDSFKDWAQLESKGGAGNMGLIFSSIPFPLDPAASRRMVAERHKEASAILGVAGPKYRANAVPYFEHINMGEQFATELTYFSDEWRTRVSRGLSYDKTLSDFMVYNVARWVKQADIDGFYLDNVFPIADDNLETGRGYRLPDGRVQPTYQLFSTRRYLLRMRAALAEEGKRNKFVLHITNHMIAPWIGAADIALDGEHHVIYPEMGKDFMDFWSLERLRVDNPATWGVVVNFLQEYQGNWDSTSLKKAMRAYTGMQLLNDTLASANANGMNPEVWTARERFGITHEGVRFLPYWDPNTELRSDSKGVYVSGWMKPSQDVKRLLLAVVNTGDETTASVAIDAGRLHFPEPGRWKAYDAETEELLPLSSSGVLSIRVPRHDYRQVIVEVK